LNTVHIVRIKAGLVLSTVILASTVFLALPIWAKDKQANPTDAVDSGSFGVYTSGHRVATETFNIKQGPNGSIVTSVFKSAQGEQQAEQSSELQLTPSVDLRRYEWKEISPEKTVAVVTPNDTFLIERFGEGPESKQHEQNFLLPASTLVLDDYFFVHREVLAWKYLATACKKDKGPVQCPMKQPVQFGALNPHGRSSMSVSIEFQGREKLTFRGAEHEFSKFVLKSEVGDWAFWLDDQFKLVRLLNDGGTEVLRD
jgi:hypothetical protein